MSEGGLRVSIVMPSYNQAPFLREAINSVLAEPYPDLELLVMDGGSTDGSVEILQSYGERIVWESTPDDGQADAINKGFRRATGDVLAWLNSDDRYVPGAVARAAAALAADPAAGMVYGEGEIIDREGKFLGRFSATQAFDLWTLVHVSDYIMQPTVFMRADALHEVGGLDQSLHFGLDWDLWIRIASRRKVLYLKEPLAQTREYADTKTSTGGWTRLRELRSIMARHGARGWPPGARAYGLDTLRLQIPWLFGPSSLAGQEALRRNPFAPLLRPIHKLYGLLIALQSFRSPRIFPDGWIGPEGRLLIPWDGRAGTLSVHIELPEDTNLSPMEVEVRAAGQTASGGREGLGHFEISLDLPGGASRLLEVTFLCSRHVRYPNDLRRLSCVLRSAAIVPRT
jgi:hypothetical protein